MVILLYITVGLCIVIIVGLMLAEIISIIVDVIDEDKRKK